MYMGQQDPNPSHPQHVVALDQTGRQQDHDQDHHQDHQDHHLDHHLLYRHQTQAPFSTSDLFDLKNCKPLDFGRIGIDFDYDSPTTSVATLDTTPSPRFNAAVSLDGSNGYGHADAASHLSSPASSSHFSPSPELMPLDGRMIATQQPYGHRASYQQQSLHQSHGQQHLRPLGTQQPLLPRHNRDSSMSSLGSAGPASPLPFHRNGLAPHITVADSGDGFGSYGGGFVDEMTNQVYSFGGKSAADPSLYWRPRATQQQQHHGLMQAPKLGARMSDQNRSMPQAWMLENGSLGPVDTTDSLGRRRSSGEPDPDSGDDDGPSADTYASYSLSSCATVYEPPKFFRTVTDSKEDALYFPPPSPTKPDLHKTPHSSANLFNQRLQMQSTQPGVGLGMPSSPATATPFPRAMGSNNGSGSSNTHGDNARFRSITSETQGQFPSLQDRGHIKTEPELSVSTTHTDAPQTMSPQDAMMHYSNAEGDQHDFGSFFTSDFDMTGTLGDFIPSMHGAPQEFSFAPHHSPHQSQAATAESEASDSEHSVEFSATGPLRNPNMDASEKTYTCTYHGCEERFDTQKDLQKHKRDAHRPPSGHHSLARSSPLTSQAGPHRCTRINPSTNRPCDTEFSRPYDLTRHEDTMHNIAKRKYRCPYCTTDTKTFSRRDALTRHHRVAHGIDTSRRRQRQIGSSEARDE